jgi:MFS family permease
MLALSLLIHVNSATHSYGAPGIVLACLSVGEAASGPISSRLLGKWGVRRVLLFCSLVCAAAIAALALVPPVVWLYAALGLVVGISVPPIMPAVRTLYPSLVPPEVVQVVFALDTSSQEVIWVVGPVLAAFLASSISTSFPLLVAAAIMLLGGIWLISAPGLRTTQIPKSTVRFGRALLHGSVALSGIASFMLVASFCALEVAIVARLGGTSTVTGVVIAANALGSMTGGLLLGHKAGGQKSLVLLMAIVFVFTGLAGFSPNTWVLIVTVFLSGFGFAPAVATMYSYVSVALPRAQSAEAFGWLSTGSLTGAAVGTAIAGYSTDHFGSAGAFAIAASFAGLGVVLAVAARGWYPHAESSLIAPVDGPGAE